MLKVLGVKRSMVAFIVEAASIEARETHIDSLGQVLEEIKGRRDELARKRVKTRPADTNGINRL